MKTNTYQQILATANKKGAAFIQLLDPDKLAVGDIPRAISPLRENGVDIVFIGGSLLRNRNFDQFVQETHRNANGLPVILFPGSLQQISPHADAILYISLISGRNPSHLIDTQVMAAPLIWQCGLEAISCGYMLVEAGAVTSAEFMSNSKPLPRNKPDIALAHALAAEYLGFKSIYLEAGSGAPMSVPENMIQTISRVVNIPLIVGGGIRTPEQAYQKVAAGANFVVIGTHFEEKDNHAQVREFADAIHHKTQTAQI